MSKQSDPPPSRYRVWHREVDGLWRAIGDYPVERSAVEHADDLNRRIANPRDPLTGSAEVWVDETLRRIA